MSRSKPTERTVSPARCWMEWKSKDKAFRYWDRAKEENVLVPLPLTFIVLDRTATVRGYSKKLQSGIYSNEVRDTREQPFLVKAFKGGEIVKGLWADIRDTVIARSGKFALNIYIAWKQTNTSPLSIGAIQAVGCSVGAWIEFEKEYGKEIYAKAVTVKTTKHDDSGDVEFNAPVFSLAEVSEATNKEAIELDRQLQVYFEDYFGKTVMERADDQQDLGTGTEYIPEEAEAVDDGVPF